MLRYCFVVTCLALSGFAGGCRIEAVRSLTNDRLAPLFWEFSDEAPGGTLKGPLSMGMGFASFEPPEPTSLAGFGGASRRLLPPNPSGMNSFFTYCLPYTEVDLAPRAKVALWQGMNTRGKSDVFAIVALDTVAVPADLSRKLLASLSERWPRLALDGSKVQFVASHSHASVAGLTENPFWSAFACDRYSPALWTFFEGRVADAFSSALFHLTPVKSVGRRFADAPGFNKTRFEGMDVQKRLTSFSFADKVTNAEASRVGFPCLQIFAVHPTWFGQTKLTLSSDVVGHFERELAIVNHGSPCLFLNGAVGNADIDEKGEGDRALDDWAARLSELAFESKLKPWSEAKQEIEFGARIIDLPAPKPNLKACGIPSVDSLVSARILGSLPPRTKIAYARIDKTMLIFYPGEALFNTARSIERAVRAVRPDVDLVQVISVANDYLGYFVDSDNFDTRALESCSALYGRKSAQDLESAIVALASESKK